MNANSLFKDMVWTPAVRLALEHVIASSAILSWGPIGTIVTLVVIHFADIFYDFMAKVIDMKKSVFVNHKNQMAFDKASLELMELADTVGEDSEEFKRQREKTSKKFSDLVRSEIARRV